MTSSLSVDDVVANTAAVVVVYNTDPASVASFADDLLNQFRTVVVADNSDDAALRARIEGALDARSLYVSMNGNQGIGAAQNRGIAVASKEGADFFVTFDQDSRPPADFLNNMAQGFCDAVSQVELAAMGPRAVDAVTGDDYDHISSETPFVVDTTLSSGLMISRDALNAIGPMDESLFIDLVDWEWCFRAKSKGLVVMIDPRVVMEHRLGERHTRIPLVGRVGTPQPWRHYYAFRNFIRLCGMSYVPLGWKLKYLTINKLKFFFYPIFMSEGRERFGHMVAGIVDGLAGRTGKRARS